MGISRTSDIIPINIKMPNPSQEPPASPKVPNQDFKDNDIIEFVFGKMGLSEVKVSLEVISTIAKLY